MTEPINNTDNTTDTITPASGETESPVSSVPSKESVYLNFGLRKIRKMQNHPFKVKTDDADMKELMESIREHGVLTPIIVRPIPDPYVIPGRKQETVYEIVSGHRRYTACQLLGLKTIPAVVREMTNDEAILAMVDSNLQRERILPSEKAFAYKMKMDVLRHQGERNDLTSCQVGTKPRSDEMIAEGTEDSARQVQRYIRLTNLHKDILEYVDSGRIALSPAVELSYLPHAIQLWLIQYMEENECTPSLSQAVQLHKLANKGALSYDAAKRIMSAEKPNQAEKISFRMGEIQKFFPRDCTPAQIHETVLRLLTQWREQENRRARSGWERDDER